MAKKKAFSLDSAQLRKYLLIAIVVIIAYVLNKKLFLMILFIFATTAGKMVRGQIANNMLMFDPLVFFSILMMKFWGFKYLLLYLFITVFVADLLSGGFSIGSFLNYALFHLCPLIGYVLFGRFSLFIYGNFVAILYSALYVPIRTKFLGGDPIATTVKGVTNVIFVYLYLVFLGPVFELIM